MFTVCNHSWFWGKLKVRLIIFCISCSDLLRFVKFCIYWSDLLRFILFCLLVRLVTFIIFAVQFVTFHHICIYWSDLLCFHCAFFSPYWLLVPLSGIRSLGSPGSQFKQGSAQHQHDGDQKRECYCFAAVSCSIISLSSYHLIIKFISS